MRTQNTATLCSVFFAASASLLAGACGTKDAAPPELTLIDAAPPPPAPTCPAPKSTMCGDTCVDVLVDEANCGACDEACNAATECKAGACGECPTDFTPSSVSSNAAGTIRPLQQFPNSSAAIYTIRDGTATHMFFIGYAHDSQRNANLALGAPQPPVVQIGYRMSATGKPFAIYQAVSGSIRFSKACDKGIAGVITDAQFLAADPTTGAISPTGCAITKASMKFELGTPSACP